MLLGTVILSVFSDCAVQAMDVADRVQASQAVVRDVLGDRAQKMFQDFLEELVLATSSGSTAVVSRGQTLDSTVNSKSTTGLIQSQAC